jgi:hypothetical protein
MNDCLRPSNFRLETDVPKRSRILQKRRAKCAPFPARRSAGRWVAGKNEAIVDDLSASCHRTSFIAAEPHRLREADREHNAGSLPGQFDGPIQRIAAGKFQAVQFISKV